MPFKTRPIQLCYRQKRDLPKSIWLPTNEHARFGSKQELNGQYDAVGGLQDIIHRTDDVGQLALCHDPSARPALHPESLKMPISTVRIARNETGRETMIFEWSLGYFVIQVVAGFLGAHVAALIAHEHRFGFIGHSLVGLVAGAFSGFFLQRIVMTTVTAAGDAMPIAGLEAQIYQAMSGLVIGGMAMLTIGVLRYEMAKSGGE
jgi:hypothetical protein